MIAIRHPYVIADRRHSDDSIGLVHNIKGRIICYQTTSYPVPNNEVSNTKPRAFRYQTTNQPVPAIESTGNKDETGCNERPRCTDRSRTSERFECPCSL